MSQALIEGRAESRTSRKDIRLFSRALMEGPTISDATIMRISLESAGAMALGGNLLLHRGKSSSQEAQASLSESLDPRALFLSTAESMLKLKFDFDKDVLGTGSPYLVLKTDSPISLIGLHCLCCFEGDRIETASMVLMTKAENVAHAFDAIIKDPLFTAALPVTIFPLVLEGAALSMKGSIAVLCDGRHYEIVIK